MDKIILNSSYCNCCNDDENILKITSGNDFSIEIQLTIKEGDEWVSYDLNDVDVDSLVVNVVSPTGERYEIDAAISSNKVVGVIDANVLEQYVVYGIEVIWRDDPYDKRAFGPRVFKLVDSSLESTSDPFDYDSDSPYEYNLHINSDIAMLSIGQIPTGDFVTLEMLDEMSYVTQTSLNTTLQDYVQTSALDDYVTQTSLNNTLQDYVQTSALDDYVTQSSLDAMSYVTTTSLNTTLQDYVQTSALDDYVTDTELQDAIAGVTIDESNLVHKTGDETIGGTKSFTNRILGQQGMTISRDILAQGAGVSHNLLGQYISTGIQTGRISSSQIAVSEIIGPHTNSEYTSEERDAIKFCRNTANNERDIVLDQMAKIDVNGIYEGTTLLEDKYLQIVDLPTIPTSTSDLTNDSGFITNSELTTALSPIESNITSLDGRVTTLENNPSVPSNVVTSDDGNEIICLTQSQYDDLETNQQLESDVFYYITDATSNYVSQSDLTNYVTQTQLNTAISGVTIDETNLVHKTGSETITGEKTFTAQNSFNYGSNIQYDDNLYGFYKSSLFSRGSFNQACIGEVILPNRNVSNSSWSLNNVANEVGFYTVTGGPATMTKTQVAKIDSNGIYEGNTLLSNKYASITDLNSLDGRVTTLEQSGSGVSQEDWDNTNEAIAQELTDNRLAHLDINNQFSNYYTKTDSDSRYATQSWANSKFVTQADDVNRQQAIAAAFASSVQSTSVHNIWTGSQNDYDAITTKDSNTMYVII